MRRRSIGRSAMRCAAIYAITLTIAGVTAGSLVAQRGRLDPDATWRVLKRHDKNGDGKVAASEYGRGEEKFRTFDRDGDGFITRADLDAPGGGGRRNRRNRTRADAYLVAAGATVALADANGDGIATAGEWKAWTGRTLAKTRMKRSAFGRLIKKRLAARRLDLNRDDFIDAGELEAAFNRLDANRDGTITPNERPQANTRRRPGRGVPQRGEIAPDFDLPFTSASRKRANGRKTMRLSHFAGKRPVGLIFGSYT